MTEINLPLTSLHQTENANSVEEEEIPLDAIRDPTDPARNRSTWKRRRFLLVVIVALIVIFTLVCLNIVILVKQCPTPKSSAAVNISAYVTTPETTPLTTTPNPNEPWHRKFLPGDILPVHYNLTFYPDLYGENGTTFDGNATITAQTIRPTRYILLHAQRMNISSYEVSHSFEKKTIAIQKAFEFPTNKYWVMVSEDLIPVNTSLTISLTFSGSLTDGYGYGFYKASHFTKNMRTNYMATTQFEPLYARKAFPSFDEPLYKAYFTIHLIHKRSHTALANTPKLSTKPSPLLHQDGDQLVLTSFQKTPFPMSTYLVCFIVVESYAARPNTSVIPNPRLRVFASVDKIQNAAFAVQVGSKIEAYFSKTFNYTSPWPKTDMIVIPHFPGAMENWGLITYAEGALLYNALMDVESARLRVGLTIAHELAHIWFGNIVTMTYWNHIWLNEGLAQYFDLVGLQYIEQQWDAIGYRTLYGTRLSAMQVDNTIKSSAVVRDINTNVYGVFDSITYEKGAALIVWLQTIMGETNFIAALRNYIKTYQYKNAETTDLLKFINTWSFGQNTVEMMNSFLYQPGYPTVTVSFDNSSKELKAQQSWFLLSPTTRSHAPPSPYNYTWWINIRYRSSDNPAAIQTVEMTYNQSKINFKSPVNLLEHPNAWILFNADSMGYYRVNYDQLLWQRIIGQLMTNHTVFTALQRAILLDDAFALTEAGTLPHKTSFDLARYLAKETHLFPWKVFQYWTREIPRKLMNTPYYDLWQSYVQSLVGYSYEKRNVVNHDYAPRDLLPPIITSIACGSSLKMCLEEASREFLNWIHTSKKPPMGTRHMTYFYGMQENDSVDNWNKLWNAYMSEDNDDEKVNLIRGLTGTRQIWLHKKLLGYLLDGKYVSSRDVPRYLSYITRTSVGQEAAWDLLNTNWPQIRDYTKLNQFDFIRLCTPNFESLTQSSAIKSFFDNNPDADQAELQSLLIRNNKRYLLWKEIHGTMIVNWLKQNQELSI